MQLDEVVVSANAISRYAMPVIKTVVGLNTGGGRVFTGIDGGLYSELPQITGMHHYQAIDDQWQLIRDEGQMRAQYAKDLSSTVDGIVIAETTVIEGALSGMAEAGLRSAVFRQGAKATLNVSQRAAEGAQIAAKGGKGYSTFPGVKKVQPQIRISSFISK